MQIQSTDAITPSCQLAVSDAIRSTSTGSPTARTTASASAPCLSRGSRRRLVSGHHSSAAAAAAASPCSSRRMRTLGGVTARPSRPVAMQRCQPNVLSGPRTCKYLRLDAHAPRATADKTGHPNGRGRGRSHTPRGIHTGTERGLDQTDCLIDTSLAPKYPIRAAAASGKRATHPRALTRRAPAALTAPQSPRHSARSGHVCRHRELEKATQLGGPGCSFENERQTP